MGKERTTGRHARRHNPLHVDYIESQELKKKNRKKYAEREKRRAEREAKVGRIIYIWSERTAKTDESCVGIC
jgi:hypothetical protein